MNLLICFFHITTYFKTRPEKEYVTIMTPIELCDEIHGVSPNFEYNASSSAFEDIEDLDASGDAVTKSRAKKVKKTVTFKDNRRKTYRYM